MSNLAKGQTVTRTVDGNVFTLTSSGDIGFINGFPVTKDEWDQALAGKKVTLTSVGEKAVLSSTGTNIMFNGKSLTKGNSISTQISSRSTTKSNSRLAGSSSSSIYSAGRTRGQRGKIYFRQKSKSNPTKLWLTKDKNL